MIRNICHFFRRAWEERPSGDAASKGRNVARLAEVSDKFLHLELDELAISESWRKRADTCLERVREIAEAIPESQSS
jgi:hypothetical protein